MDAIEQNFKKFITVSRASRILGVSKATVRKWADEGKIEMITHPLNKYRLFRIETLKELLCKLKK